MRLGQSGEFGAPIFLEDRHGDVVVAVRPVQDADVLKAGVDHAHVDSSLLVRLAVSSLAHADPLKAALREGRQVVLDPLSRDPEVALHFGHHPQDLVFLIGEVLGLLLLQLALEQRVVREPAESHDFMHLGEVVVHFMHLGEVVVVVAGREQEVAELGPHLSSNSI